MSKSFFPPQSSRREVLRAGLFAAAGAFAATELLGTTTAAASSKATSDAARVSIVGDSLTEGTMPYQAETLSYLGWGPAAIDAYKSRGIRTKMKGDAHNGLTAVDAIRTISGDSNVWVVALGTNDAGFYKPDEQPQVISEMLDRIGPGHYVVWVNVYLPATPARQRTWNSALTAVAKERSDQMFVLDWATLAEENPKWMAGDQIHCTGTGYKNRASVIAQATKTLVPSTPPVKLLPLARRQFIKAGPA